MVRHRLAEARRADDDGFTLIELLIVIVVLGVLAGIVVFGVGTFRADSVSAAACANANTVEVASDAYIAAKGVPAADIAALVAAKYLKTVPTPAPTYAAATGVVTIPSGCS